jgi:hypothetical protein
LRNIFHASIPELWIHGHENTNITEKDEEVEISSSCNIYLLLHALLKQMNCLESQNGKDDSACIDSGECIRDDDDKGTLLYKICCECVKYLWCEHVGQR